MPWYLVLGGALVLIGIIFSAGWSCGGSRWERALERAQDSVRARDTMLVRLRADSAALRERLAAIATQAAHDSAATIQARATATKLRADLGRLGRRADSLVSSLVQVETASDSLIAYRPLVLALVAERDTLRLTVKADSIAIEKGEAEITTLRAQIGIQREQLLTAEQKAAALQRDKDDLLRQLARPESVMDRIKDAIGTVVIVGLGAAGAIGGTCAATSVC